MKSKLRTMRSFLTSFDRPGDLGQDFPIQSSRSVNKNYVLVVVVAVPNLVLNDKPMSAQSEKLDFQ